MTYGLAARHRLEAMSAAKGE
ncbi:hypothetical protein SBA6_590029 [Candidatus Sulfopaludibacter sp. SbA6]|nr:hypothetical protein SBA6_590029 [Candidatus Sulfopaludibacter sp. SbA6]